MVLPDSIHLRGTELAWLLQARRDEIGPTSPLNAALEQAGKRKKKPAKRALESLQALSGSAELPGDGLRPLFAPVRLVRLIAPTPQQTYASCYYGAQSADALALMGFWPDAEGWQVTALHPARELFEEVAEMLGHPADGQGKAQPQHWSMPRRDLMALAAAVDAIRFRHTVDLLARRVTTSPRFSEENLADMWSLGHASPDPRWLLSGLRSLIPDALFDTGPDGDDACPALPEPGWLEPQDDGNWTPSERLAALAADLCYPLPSLAVTSIASGPNGLIERKSHQAYLRGASAYYRIECDGLFDDPNGMVTVAMERTLADVMAPLARVVERPATRSAGEHLAAAADDKGSRQHAFCAQCGAALKAKARFCTKCGAAAADD